MTLLVVQRLLAGLARICMQLKLPLSSYATVRKMLSNAPPPSPPFHFNLVWQ